MPWLCNQPNLSGMNKQKKTPVLIIALLLLGVASLLTLALLKDFGKLPAPAAEKSMGPIGAPFTLIDQNGEKFSSTELAPNYQLVYFGFTTCPDICPVELQKMTTALKESGTAAQHVQPVFITVDPVRDTPEAMKKYLANFDPHFIGLTGTEKEIDDVLAAFKVYAAKVEDDTYSDYLVDHSSFIYLLGPEFELIKLFGKDSKPSDVAAGIREAVGEAAAAPEPEAESDAEATDKNAEPDAAADTPTASSPE